MRQARRYSEELRKSGEDMQGLATSTLLATRHLGLALSAVGCQRQAAVLQAAGAQPLCAGKVAELGAAKPLHVVL